MVPQEILEKPGKLDDVEWSLMRTHSFHTHRVLSSLKWLETIASWAAMHHERLNGEGYLSIHQAARSHYRHAF